MSKGMYCSASQVIELASSPSVIAGSVIFLTITALPESDAATSRFLMPSRSKSRRMASATAVPSMMAPSTMVSAGSGSMPKATTFQPLPEAFSSTALTALDPISSPTTGFCFRNSTPTSPRSGTSLRLGLMPNAQVRNRQSLIGKGGANQICNQRSEDLPERGVIRPPDSVRALAVL